MQSQTPTVASDSDSESVSDAESDSDSISDTESASDSGSESDSESVSGTESESLSDSDSELMDEEESELASAEMMKQQAMSLRLSESESQRLDSEDASLSISASLVAESESVRLSEEASTADENAKSQAISLSQSAAAVSESLASQSMAISEYEEHEYNSTSEAFKADDFLEKRMTEIREAEKKLRELQESKQAEVKSDKYWEAIDAYTNALIQYKVYQDDNVREIITSEWVNGLAEYNHVKVEYKDNDGNLHTEYYDFVYMDSNGNKLPDGVDKK